MPSKRVKRTKQTEQKKIVTSTLLTISLKFDNHLYAKEIISLQQAKDYIREISKLKIESNDARSRQVSEKLTSVLKALINEYTNKITDNENSNTISSNYSIKKKLNENFASKSNEGLNIRPEFCDFSVVATNGDHSENNFAKPDNIEERIDTINTINISKDNMSNNIPNKEIPVKNNSDYSENVNLCTALPVENFNMSGPPTTTENVNESSLKDTNKEPSAIKNKTACTNDTNMIISTECANNRIISRANVKESSKSKKRNTRKKQKNDLTWFEDIKFIREIDREEHLASNLEESFGSDLTKPADCSPDFEID